MKTQYIENKKQVFYLIAIYAGWISTHYACSHIYIEYCTPKTIKGFIISPFIVATPHCTGLRWCITEGANTINTMWSVIGAWVATRAIMN